MFSNFIIAKRGYCRQICVLCTAVIIVHDVCFIVVNATSGWPIQRAKHSDGVEPDTKINSITSKKTKRMYGRIQTHNILCER